MSRSHPFAAAIPGPTRLTQDCARAALLQLQDHLRQATKAAQEEATKAATTATTPPAVILDLAGLQQFDSSALAVLLDVQRNAQSLGLNFNWTHMPVGLQQLAQLYGLDFFQDPPSSPPAAQKA